MQANRLASRGTRDGLQEVLLILTADCNLRCSYCYQQRTAAGAMPWPVVEASLDVLLASPDARMVSMTGGEPLLESGTVRRIVQHVKARARGRAIDFHLVSNGVLLAPGRHGDPLHCDIPFLVENDVRLDLSIDGNREAQDVRAPGTFDRLDALLDRLNASFPDYLRRRVTATVTIGRKAIPHLAASMDYLLGKHVADIVLQPGIGDQAWTSPEIELLDAQCALVWRSSLLHYLRTERVPIRRFRESSAKGTAHTEESNTEKWPCGAPRGGSLAVDVDGSVYPCVLMAGSYSRRSPQLEGRLAHVALGNVRDGASRIACRLGHLADGAHRSGVFDGKSVQHAGDRRCESCPLADDCFVCPLARAMDAPGDDVNRVPDNWCAFNRVLLKYRRYLPIQSTRAATLAALADRLRADWPGLKTRPSRRPSA